MNEEHLVDYHTLPSFLMVLLVRGSLTLTDFLPFTQIMKKMCIALNSISKVLTFRFRSKLKLIERFIVIT